MQCKTCGGGRSFRKTVDGRRITVNCPICDGTGEVEDTLPAKERTMSDPFEPDWNEAPEWAEWHAVDETGDGNWMESTPDILEPNSDPGVWYVTSAYADRYIPSDFDGDLIGLDWRNSLRHRPEAK